MLIFCVDVLLQVLLLLQTKEEEKWAAKVTGGVQRGTRGGDSVARHLAVQLPRLDAQSKRRVLGRGGRGRRLLAAAPSTTPSLARLLLHTHTPASSRPFGTFITFFLI